jgi:hypothetical protein
VIEIEQARPAGRCLHEIAGNSLAATMDLGSPEPDLVGAALRQQIVDAKRVGLGDATAVHLLAADPVPEGALALQDQHPEALRGQCEGKRRTGESAADNDQVIVHPGPQLPISGEITVSDR